MAPKRTLYPVPHVPIVTIIDEPLFTNDCAYVPEPPMEYERINIWYFDALIPYSILGSIFYFMGTLPKRVKIPYILKDFFPDYPSCERLVFVDEPFDFSYFKSRVFSSYPPTDDDSSYIQWLNRIQERKKHF